MKEKDFINKVHKSLPPNVYRWKINDGFHGGIPDTYYESSKNIVFIEYKFIPKLPVKPRSKIKVNTSSLQKQWLQRAKNNNVPAFVTIGSPGPIVITDEVTIEFFTLEDFLKQSIEFDDYIKRLVELTT